MLHLISYALAAAALALTLLLHGPRAFAYDGHPLQWFEAAMMLWLGAELFRITRLRPTLLLLLAAGCAWLAVDELLMFHECAKWRGLLPRMSADPLVVFYAVAGAAAGVALLRLHPEKRRALPHLVLAALGALFAVLADLHLFGVQTSAALIAEEGGEFLALAGAISVLRAAPAVPLLRPAAWVLFSALWLGTSLWLVRPWLCPARLL